MKFFFYTEEGVIDEVFHAPSEEFAKAQSGEYVVAGEEKNPESFFVNTCVDPPCLEKRAPIEARVESIGFSATIKGIPAGSEVVVGKTSAISDERGLVVEFDLPGTYEIRIYPPPQFLDETLEVTVG